MVNTSLFALFYSIFVLPSYSHINVSEIAVNVFSLDRMKEESSSPCVAVYPGPLSEHLALCLPQPPVLDYPAHTAGLDLGDLVLPNAYRDRLGILASRVSARFVVHLSVVGVYQ